MGRRADKGKKKEDWRDKTGSGGWGCSHESGGNCNLLDRECQPGVRGCILYPYMKKSEASKD